MFEYKMNRFGAEVKVDTEDRVRAQLVQCPVGSLQTSLAAIESLCLPHRCHHSHPAT